MKSFWTTKYGLDQKYILWKSVCMHPREKTWTNMCFNPFFSCNFVSALHSFSHLYPPPPYPSRNHYAIWLRVNDKLCHLSMQQNTCFILKKICHKYNSRRLLMVFNEFFLIIFSRGTRAQHLTLSVVCVVCCLTSVQYSHSQCVQL